VNSDFGGAEKRERLLGQTLSGGASAAAPQKLYLRIGYGDVMVLALRQPKTP
jgi:hypothetical protein